MTYDFLKDQYFLKQLDELRLKEQFVRLTVLSWTEEAVSEIQGKAISGSLTLDGTSSVRRTASFTMFAEQKENDLSHIDQDLSINRKVRLEIGFRNTVPTYMYDTRDEKTHEITHHYVNYKELYGDIVWFPLGIFVIFDPSISHQVQQGVTISISLKDKMCLLNGDAGGVIPASVTFSEKEDSNGDIQKPLISQIIFQLVNHFGAEDAAKIVIEDIDDKIKQVMKYTGSNPIYYLETTGGTVTTRRFFLDRTEALNAAAATGQDESDIVTFEYGDDIGFVLTDFVYPGELTCNPGDTVTSVLDKIIAVLGNFEYFYDVYGNFHFQEIKNYLNTTYTTTVMNKLNESPSYDVDFSSGKSVYTFEGTKLISAVTNAPAYSNVKNDYMVWGVRKSADGETEIPVRYHLAIDHKPEIGQEHYVNFYEDDYGITRAGAEFTFTYNNTSEFPNPGAEATLYIVDNLNNRQFYRWSKDKGYYQVKQDDCMITTVDWRQELYYEGIEAQDTGTDRPYYFAELLNEWPKLFNLKTQQFYDSVKENPSGIDFWLDMIDDTAEVGEYSVDNIGRRGVVVQQDQINCVFEQEVPDLVFIDINQNEADIQQEKRECDAAGQDWVQVDSTIYSLLTIGGSQNSCYERICDMLYQYTNMNQSITISAIPIYYLEPNTRITVRDDAAGINGQFMISSISLPLDVESSMNISAYQCKQKI